MSGEEFAGYAVTDFIKQDRTKAGTRYDRYLAETQAN
jgi:hypothetical protein